MEENFFFFLGIQRQRLQEMKETLFFLEIQRERLAAKVQPGEARFGPELDGEKLWRHQVFGARMREKNERKLFFLEIQRQRLAAKVQPGEARFGPELDGEKLWRRQVFRARKDARKERKRFNFNRDSEGAFGSKSASRGGSFWTRIRLGKAVA